MAVVEGSSSIRAVIFAPLTEPDEPEPEPLFVHPATVDRVRSPAATVAMRFRLRMKNHPSVRSGHTAILVRTTWGVNTFDRLSLPAIFLHVFH
jgi:hypothetical protein